jgi:hypothetical protein
LPLLNPRFVSLYHKGFWYFEIANNSKHVTNILWRNVLTSNIKLIYKEKRHVLFISLFENIDSSTNVVLSIFSNKLIKRTCLFSSPDPKGHVSYCHHLASVVRRKPFQKSSPLKVLDQWKPNLVWIITRVSSFKIVSGDAVHQPTWPLLLKIEHMVKLQVLGNNSKTVNNIKNLTWGKKWSAQQDLPTHLGVIALFSSNL